MKLKFLILNFSFLILTACGVTKPVATTHVERFEEKVMPIPVGADTIEITLSRDARSERPQCRDTRLMHPNECRDARSERPSKTPKTSKASKNNCELCIVNCALTKSTRPFSLQTAHTDSNTRIKLTLRPDTVFIPYTNHIRSDTIVVPDRICKTKLQKTQTANVLLILIIIVATIIFFLKNKITR